MKVGELHSHVTAVMFCCRFNVGYANWMKPDDVKARFRVLFATKINKADEIIVTAETQRTQVPIIYSFNP